MLSLNATATTLVAASGKTALWLFDVDHDNNGTIDYRWSTINTSFGGNAYTFKVLKNSYSVTLSRNNSEIGLQSPNTAKFIVSNPSNSLSASTFSGGRVTIRLVLSGTAGTEEIASWKMDIKQCHAINQTLVFDCRDFLQKYLDGYYPTTPLTSPLFPSNSSAPAKHPDDGMCIPEPYGVCYIPTRPIYFNADSAVYYLLGPDANTYTVTKVHTPKEVSTTSEYDSGSYTFTQLSKSDGVSTWKVLRPQVYTGETDSGVWTNGDDYLWDVPVKFSRNDTVSTTSPADVIQGVLENMGIATADIDVAGSFATADTTYTSWGLTFNGAFFYKRSRREVLAELLNSCHSVLKVTDKIELHVLVKASQKSLATNDIIREQGSPLSTFKYNPIYETKSDSGYVAFTGSGKPQDTFQKIIVPADGSTKNNPSNDTLTVPFVSDTQDVQTIGRLYFQRKYWRDASISFRSKSTLIALQPDDFITISSANYGGSYTALIDRMTIKPDLSIDFACTRYSGTIQDWGDFTPSSVTFQSDSIDKKWYPLMFGPDGTVSSGNQNNKVHSGKVRFANGTDLIMEGSGISDANRAYIAWPLTNCTLKIGSDYGNDSMHIYSDTAGTGTLQIGYDSYDSTGGIFKRIGMIADSSISISTDDLTLPIYNKLSMSQNTTNLVNIFETWYSQYSYSSLDQYSASGYSYSKTDVSGTVTTRCQFNIVADNATGTGNGVQIYGGSTIGDTLVTLEQYDISEEFFEFIASASTGTANPLSTGTTPGNLVQKVKVLYNGTTGWIYIYDS